MLSNVLDLSVIYSEAPSMVREVLLEIEAFSAKSTETLEGKSRLSWQMLG